MPFGKMPFLKIFLPAKMCIRDSTYTTSPIVLTDAIERLLRPLARLHLPVHELAMMMTIALRFIDVYKRQILVYAAGTAKGGRAMRILGVDPGYAIVGFGALEYARGAFCPLQYLSLIHI